MARPRKDEGERKLTGKVKGSPWGKMSSLFRARREGEEDGKIFGIFGTQKNDLIIYID